MAIKDQHEAGRGTLIAIGGHEDKEQDMLILRRVAQRIGDRRLVVATVASSMAEEMWEDYRKVFGQLGVKDIALLKLEDREEAVEGSSLAILENAGGIFFTGGDQLRITSKLGGTALCDGIHQMYERGGVIAGTSAGASVLTETMIVSGGDDRTHRISDSLLLAPGLGFLPAAVIDQHFAERGRISRLVGIVAQNPRTLGIGIDENTAIEIQDQNRFEVFGAGAVYVLDGRPVTQTNVSEEEQQQTISAFHLCLHVLSQGDSFEIPTRTPISGPAAKVTEQVMGREEPEGAGVRN